ncbi:MAG: hypothetical protein CVU40_12600 [Chloroflexi bacterium HGW-Chloroflexi-2]|nr:MAG: hypothetical protein CVU40_12600 [Chloroflexi bacterium HGW-Chloroflexi-2]
MSLPEWLVPPLHGFKSMDSQNPNLFKQVTLRTDCAESFSKDFLIYYPMNTYPVDLIHRIPVENKPVLCAHIIRLTTTPLPHQNHNYSPFSL